MSIQTDGIRNRDIDRLSDIHKDKTEIKEPERQTEQ